MKGAFASHARLHMSLFIDSAAVANVDTVGSIFG